MFGLRFVRGCEHQRELRGKRNNLLCGQKDMYSVRVSQEAGRRRVIREQVSVIFEPIMGFPTQLGRDEPVGNDHGLNGHFAKKQSSQPASMVSGL